LSLVLMRLLRMTGGYLHLYDEVEETSVVVVMAQEMTAEPVARIIPTRVPYGFHGTWLHSADHRVMELNAVGSPTLRWLAPAPSLAITLTCLCC